MLKKILFLIIFSWFNLHCQNTQLPDSDKGTTNGIDNSFLLTYSLFFVVPNLDFNQFCPPTDQIPILEPGTHTRFMQAGDTFLFDNRARFQQSAPAGEERLFTFIIQENPGQETKLVSPYCGNNDSEYEAQDDSGLAGQTETVFIGLKTPPLPIKRLGFFTKLRVLSGAGTISFTTPTAPDPLNAH